MTLPIQPMTLPSNLRNAPNGNLPPSLLVPSFIPGGTWRMHPTAARAMRAMVAAMAATGIQVRATGTYRSLAQQTSLFTSRYRPVSHAAFLTTPASRRKTWAGALTAGYGSIYWVKIQLPNGSYPATAAVPGTSNHGLGLAVDFAQELDGDPAPESVARNMVDWLVANARGFGYSAELQSEPWHWRYVTGDAVPAAVTSFEVGLQAVPPTTPTAPVPPADLAAIAQGIAQAKTHTLRQGSGGADARQPERDAVVWCQIGLANARYDVGKADGDFGSRTDREVRKFQADRRMTVDGVVGPRTWGYLFP